MHNDNFDNLLIKFNSIINKITRIEKKAIFNIDGIHLTTHQIHLIDLIGRFPNINVTELANASGVTKGAVSQKLSWLEKRGFLVKVKGDENNKEIFVKLTDSGHRAFDMHLEYHRKFDSELFDMFRNMSEENATFVNAALTKVDDIFTRLLEEENVFIDNKVE